LMFHEVWYQVGMVAKQLG
jgi:hypothetical protein